MQISFHGIKNAGAQRWIDDENPQTYKNGEIIKLDKGQHINLHFELTNQNGNDLDEFKPVLKKNPYHYNPNSVDLTYDEYTNAYTLKREKIFVLNDKMIDVNRENMGLLSRLAVLLKRISQMQDDEIKTEYSYLEHGTEADDAFRYYKKEFQDENENFKPSEYKKMVFECHNPNNTKKAAKSLCKKIETAVCEYIYK